MGTWGTGPFQNDVALDFLGSQRASLVALVERFLDAPDSDEFARVFAALELLNLLAKHTAAGTPAPTEVEQWTTILLERFDRDLVVKSDAEFYGAQRKVLEETLATLVAHAREFHPDSPGQKSSALSRALERIGGGPESDDFLFSISELTGWVAPYGDDIDRAWAECVRTDHMLAMAQALGVEHTTLVAIVRSLLQPAFARLPADAPNTEDAEALEHWAALVRENHAVEERWGLAPLACAAAHLVRASAASERNHLGLALKDLLSGVRITASVAAKKAGMSWHVAMTASDGPAWTAHRACDTEMADRLRELLPADWLRTA